MERLSFDLRSYTVKLTMSLMVKGLQILFVILVMTEKIKADSMGARASTRQ